MSKLSLLACAILCLTISGCSGPTLSAETNIDVTFEATLPLEQNPPNPVRFWYQDVTANTAAETKEASVVSIDLNAQTFKIRATAKKMKNRHIYDMALEQENQGIWETLAGPIDEELKSSSTTLTVDITEELGL